MAKKRSNKPVVDGAGGAGGVVPGDGLGDRRSGSDGHAGEGQDGGIGARGGRANHTGVFVVGPGHVTVCGVSVTAELQLRLKETHAFDVDAREPRGHGGADAHRSGGEYRGN